MFKYNVPLVPDIFKRFKTERGISVHKEQTHKLKLEKSSKADKMTWKLWKTFVKHQNADIHSHVQQRRLMLTLSRGRFPGAWRHETDHHIVKAIYISVAT